MYEKTTDQIGASVSFLDLASTMDDKINKRLIVSASQLLQPLSMDSTNTDISETTLITRYIVPLLQPLFDNGDLNIRVDFTATELAEKCKRPLNFNRRPDCTITRFPHQTDDGINIGYDEVKKITAASNHDWWIGAWFSSRSSATAPLMAIALVATSASTLSVGL
ncbi:hypothetical protein RMATCC62417_17007 [Rhizopus microsporus]|nr:hypothetical protein RMATCC62417_17007 [Rhizopus microsporus]